MHLYMKQRIYKKHKVPLTSIDHLILTGSKTTLHWLQHLADVVADSHYLNVSGFCRTLRYKTNTHCSIQSK